MSYQGRKSTTQRRRGRNSREGEKGNGSYGWEGMSCFRERKHGEEPVQEGAGDRIRSWGSWYGPRQKELNGTGRGCRDRNRGVCNLLDVSP